MKSTNNKGPRMEPCGTPDRTSINSELQLPRITGDRTELRSARNFECILFYRSHYYSRTTTNLKLKKNARGIS